MLSGERGLKSALSPDPEHSPRVLLPVLGAAEGEESGWWRDAEWLEMMKVRLLWLFIGVLSRAGWMEGVITDDELAVLIICACSSRNWLIKHHFRLYRNNKPKNTESINLSATKKNSINSLNLNKNVTSWRLRREHEGKPGKLKTFVLV